MTESMAMRFGIPSIDELFGSTSNGEAGISVPRKADAVAAIPSMRPQARP